MALLMTVEEVALELGVKPVTLYSKRFRTRLGLVATKIGRNVRFHIDDVERVIQAGREKLPPMPAKELGGDESA